MIDLISALIPWSGAVAIVAIVAKCVHASITLYYQDKKNQRLERIDLELQRPELALERQALNAILKQANSTKSRSLLGTKVAEELVRLKYLPEEVADKITW